MGPFQAAVHLSGRIGSRPSASRNERRAHQYVAKRFRAAGLDVSVNHFRVRARGRSENVVRVKREGRASDLRHHLACDRPGLLQEPALKRALRVAEEVVKGP